MPEPENATVEQVLSGKGICSGYVPGTTPGQYMEVWEYNGYVYAVVIDNAIKDMVVYKLGVRW